VNISRALDKAGGSKNYAAQREIIQGSETKIKTLLAKIEEHYKQGDEKILKLHQEIIDLDIKKTQIELILDVMDGKINMRSKQHNKIRKKMQEIRDNAMTASDYEDKIEVEIDFVFIWKVQRQRHETGKKKNLLESLKLLEQKHLQEWSQLNVEKMDKVQKETELKQITEDLIKKKKLNLQHNIKKFLTKLHQYMKKLQI